MVFFDNTKTLGIIFEVVGLMLLFDALITILSAFTDLGGLLIKGEMKYCLIAGGGEAIGAMIYIVNAHRVMKGSYGSKLGVLSYYIITVGLTTMIVGISSGIAQFIDSGTLDFAIVMLAIYFIIGMIVMSIGLIIRNGRRSIGKKIIRYILIVAFVIMLLFCFLPAETETDLIDYIAHLIIALFMLMLLYDPEVKMEMGA